MDKVASLFYPLLFAFSSRQAIGASHIPVCWMEKKPQMWLLWAVQEKRSGSAISSDWLKMSKLKESFSPHSGCPVRAREQQDLGLCSKSTRPGAHLEFLMLILSFHCHAGSLYPEGCTRRIKRALWELYCIRLLYLQSSKTLLIYFCWHVSQGTSALLFFPFFLGSINFRSCFL